MKTTIIFLLTCFYSVTSANAQINGELLFGLISGTTEEISNITNPTEGSLVYNSDEEKMYLNTASGFKGIPSSDEVSNSFYVGTFQITGAGEVIVSGIPFQPSSITFTAYANIASMNVNGDNEVANNDNTAINVHGSMKGFARNNGATITQQVIFNGASGSSVNDISRYASSSYAIGLRYSNNNGDNLGLTTASISSFNTDGFTINTNNFTGGILIIYEAYR
jgi:hypothetical protein